MAHGGVLLSSLGGLFGPLDTGHPFLNRVVDGFLTIAAVGAYKIGKTLDQHGLLACSTIYL